MLLGPVAWVIRIYSLLASFSMLALSSSLKFLLSEDFLAGFDTLVIASFLSRCVDLDLLLISHEGILDSLNATLLFMKDKLVLLMIVELTIEIKLLYSSM